MLEADNNGAFALEKEMTPIAKAWLEARGLVVRAECYGHRVGCPCDLMGVEVNPKRAKMREQARQATPLTREQLGMLSSGKVTAAWFPLETRVITMELKLHRIGEVLCQACGWLSEADESWAALPLERAMLAAKLGNLDSGNICYREECKATRVGILGVTRNECKVVRPPAKGNGPDPARRALIAERFWRAGVGRRADHFAHISKKVTNA